MEAFPKDMHKDYQQATESYSTTNDVRRKIRVRYIPLSRMSDDHRDVIEEYLASFQHLYSRTIQDQDQKSLDLAKMFLDALNVSSSIYDR